jgi:catechol-2,3-dioxygenase
LAGKTNVTFHFIGREFSVLETSRLPEVIFTIMERTYTYGLTHLALAVKDVNRTQAFYQLVFNMETMYLENGFLQMTTPGCNDIIVFEEIPDKPIGDTGGILHFGFRLRDGRDMEEMVNKIIAAGGIIKSQGFFVPGSPFVFFSDPDGYELEVWYEMLASPPGEIIL